MAQTITRTGRRTGWSEFENKLLWEAADEAQMNGLPLKAVFEHIAQKTGRRPNSIRNYYYAQVQKREGGQQRTARFVPFTQNEVDWLIEQVLRARAQGQSVRSCLSKISGGDHSRMLRLQNKYRSVIKTRPDYVREMVDRLNHEGVPCDQPQVNHRARPDMNAACQDLVEEAQRFGDVDLARACETLTRYLKAVRTSAVSEEYVMAARQVIDPVKQFLAISAGERRTGLNDFLNLLSERIGALEAQLPIE